MIRHIAGLVDRVLNWFAPPFERFDVLLTDDDLADIEADFEVFEPHDFPAPPLVSEGSPLRGGKDTGDPPSLVEPADADPGSVGVGGFVPKSDEQLIEELVADYRSFVRDCFKRRG